MDLYHLGEMGSKVTAAHTAHQLQRHVKRFVN